MLCKRHVSCHYVCDKGECWVVMCMRCARAHEEEQVKERSTPAGKPTFLRCSGGCDITLQVPSAAIVSTNKGAGSVSTKEGASGSDEESSPHFEQIGQQGLYTISLELRIEAMPPRGQQSALVRFAPAEFSLSRRKHRASVYISEKGYVGSERRVKRTEEDEGQGEVVKTRLYPGRWTVLSVAVDVEAGKMSCYLDGVEHVMEEGLDKRDLKLGHRLVILGGGKGAQSRGGSVRRVLLHETCLSAADALDVYTQICRDNPSVGSKVIRIQKAWRYVSLYAR